MYRIFIAENIPSLNKGEMTILEGMLESFTSLGKVEVIMLSSVPDIDQPRYGTKVRVIDATNSLHLFGNPKSYSQAFRILASTFVTFQHLLFLVLYKILGAKTLKLMKSEIWKEYVESDVILVGHNGTFGIGGATGIAPYFSFLYMPLLRRVLGKPLVVYGGSIGQFRRPFGFLGNPLLKLALSKVDLVTLRERISHQHVKGMGFQNDRISLTGDPAFLLRPAPPERIKDILAREGIHKGSKPLIGVTVTRKRASLAFPQFKNPDRSYIKHAEVFAEAIDNLVAKLDATVIFVPHCIGYGEKLDDRIVAKDIVQRCRNKEQVKMITNEYSAAELKGLIGQFDFFIGERLHSVINAVSMGVLSIVICNSSDQRLDIIRMLGQDNAICFVENLDAGALLLKIDNIWSKKERIREELKSQTEIMMGQAMLNGKLLKQLLDSRKQKIETS